MSRGRKTISRHRPIVYFEYIDDLAQKHAFSVDDFQRFFADLDYRISWVNNSSDAQGLFSEQPSTHLTAIPRERDLGCDVVQVRVQSPLG